MTLPSPETTLLTFPTDFPIKIMGLNQEKFKTLVTQLIHQHVPEFDPETLEVRQSSGQKYLSLTCTVIVESQQQLDALYITLSGHPDVLMVL
ncbi:MAG: DUF493 domain-containing protein [Pseudomonadota bacterium]